MDIPCDKIIAPSSPIKLLLIFNFAKLHFSSEINSANCSIPSLPILLLDIFNISIGK